MAESLEPTSPSAVDRADPTDAASEPKLEE